MYIHYSSSSNEETRAMIAQRWKPSFRPAGKQRRRRPRPKTNLSLHRRPCRCSRSFPGNR